MMRITRRRLLGGLAAAAGTVAPSVRAQGGLKIGLTLPLSGAPEAMAANRSAIPDTGFDFLAGFQQAVQLERRGFPIEVIELDDAFDPARAAANVETLVQRDVVAISGLWTSEQTAAALPAAMRWRVPLVGLHSTAAEHRTRNPWVFHLKASDTDELNAVLKTLINMNVSRVGILYEDGPRNRRLLQQVLASGASISRAMAVTPEDKDGLAAAARELVRVPGTQSILLLLPTGAVVDAMIALRGPQASFFAPVCALSDVISTSLAISRERGLNGLGVASPFSNPGLSRTEVAHRFREAMMDQDLDAMTRSFTAFEGFVYGSVITRTLVAMKGVATRETLAAALRGRALNLGGLPIRFDDRQVGHQMVQLLYKYAAEGALKS